MKIKIYYFTHINYPKNIQSGAEKYDAKKPNKSNTSMTQWQGPCHIPENLDNSKLGQFTESKFCWHSRNNPLFFAKSDYRIYTRLQPLLQIIDKFFIIFCRIGIFRSEIFFYLIKLMNFQFGRVIFWVRILIGSLRMALLSNVQPIRDRYGSTS